jgi:hypothetical protein
MKKISYKGYRFPPEIIQQAIWLYVRFTLSFRDVEDLLAERGIMVSYETVPLRPSQLRRSVLRSPRRFSRLRIAQPVGRARAHSGRAAMPCATGGRDHYRVLTY